jgi:phage RecT family recombinase
MATENALVTLVNTKKSELWQVKASYLTETQDVYFKRAILNIFENSDLVTLSNNPTGARSIFMCLSRALQMGLQIGGQTPQAYLVPFGGKAELIPTAAGYRYIVTSEPPVLTDYVQKPVYDGDECKIDAMTGEVKHMIKITETKRKMIGIYAVFTELDGTKHADYISRGDIESIRDKWSKQPSGKAWTNAFEAMAMQKAAKHFLKPYAAQKEGLAMALAVSEENDATFDIPDVIDITENKEDKKSENKKNEKELF